MIAVPWEALWLCFGQSQSPTRVRQYSARVERPLRTLLRLSVGSVGYPSAQTCGSPVMRYAEMLCRTPICTMPIEYLMDSLTGVRAGRQAGPNGTHCTALHCVVRIHSLAFESTASALSITCDRPIGRPSTLWVGHSQQSCLSCGYSAFVPPTSPSMERQDALSNQMLFCSTGLRRSARAPITVCFALLSITDRGLWTIGE